MHRTPVHSSAISSAGFDPATRTLEIEFRSGGIYDYADVPQHVFDELMRAPSVGRYYREHIRDRFAAIRLGDVPLADVMEEEREDALFPRDDLVEVAPSAAEAGAEPVPSYHTWIVDVIEDDAAAVEVDGRQVTPLPRWLLPSEARVNDRLLVTHVRRGDRSELTIELAGPRA